MMMITTKIREMIFKQESAPNIRKVAMSQGMGTLFHDGIQKILEGTTSPKILEAEDGDLVLFRGRNSIHRVTPTQGRITRMLVVFAFNDQPGIGLSESALETFYGRVC